MAQSVGDNQVRSAEHGIVSQYLIKNLLGYLNIRSLVFNDHQRIPGIVKNNGVTPAQGVVQPQGHLVPHPSAGKSLAVDQKFNEVLPDPFLRGKDEPFATQRVINTHGACIILFQAYVTFRKIKFNHSAKIAKKFGVRL